MGRTLKTMNQLVTEEQRAFSNFRRTLRRRDQLLFDQLFIYIKHHTAAISMANHALPLESMLLAICLEQEKRIQALQDKVEALASADQYQ